MRLNTFSIRRSQLLLAVFGLALGLTFAGVHADGPKPTLAIESVAWMAGNWELDDGPVKIDERWSPVAGKTMIGTSRTIADDRMVFFEFLRIEGRADGVVYVAQPKGRHPGTEFKLVKAGDHEAVFENLAHDFPKRIIYRLGTDGGLTARIEGDGSEKEKPQEYRYKPASR